MAQYQCEECDWTGTDDDVPNYTLKACAEIMRKRGWKIKEPQTA